MIVTDVLHFFVVSGQHATWPMLAVVHEQLQTCLETTFSFCLLVLFTSVHSHSIADKFEYTSSYLISLRDMLIPSR